MSSTRPRATLLRAPVLPEQTTPEQRYWRAYGATQLVKEHNSVTSIAFNPQQPNDFAIAASTRVQLFSSRTRQVIKTFSRFKDVVYAANFRPDGKLLAMGDATGLVSVYDSYNPRTQLLSIRASSHPTHVAKFHSTDPKSLVTASDDRVVRVWDISQAQQPLTELTGATDYVRSICMVPQAPHLVVTGSYDGFVRLYDTRVGSNSKPTTLAQGLPVDDVVAVSPTQLVSCGGPSFKVWDLTAQRQLLERTNFAKTVTCLNHVSLHSDSPMDSTLVASSLDGHVKIFDPLDGYKVKFGWKFSAPVLSCAVSPGDAQGNRHLVAGLSSGLLAIRTKKKSDGANKVPIEKVAKSNNFQRMMRGSEYAGDQEHIIHNDKTRPQRKLRAFERHMNQFKWAEALDAAFLSGMARELTLTALHELRKRGKIRVALLGRDESSLEPLLNWCLKGIEDVRSATVVADWIAVVLELYSDLIARSSVLEEMIVALKDKVKQEVHRAEEAQKIEGMLQLLVS
ncbi:LADA_0G10462g1_1 [Lachancea dasiensis]|uniref:LADA_0G10462g1_1 n=1 Tax=Lachancea dasiensis TaxID=1072105 RepID=A0A1G4JUP8_9SACH|nr:LADA_0G10462g1_1 [Lachancea dasiensis]